METNETTLPVELKSYVVGTLATLSKQELSATEYLVRKMQVIFASKIKEEEKNEDELNDIIKVYLYSKETDEKS